MDTCSAIHYQLIKAGFKRQPGDSEIYRGEMKVNEKIFQLEITEIDENFIKLPRVRLLKLPDELPCRLPHLEPNGICYLDPLSVSLDRYDPAGAISVVVYAVKKVLTSWVTGETLDEEHAAEFEAYWAPKYYSYVRSSSSGIKQGAIYQRINLAGEERYECVLADDKESIDDWTRKRNAFFVIALTVGVFFLLTLVRIPI